MGCGLPESSMQLANGLLIRIEDRSRRYFGDYHLVKLVLSATVHISTTAGLTAEERVQALHLLGESVTYCKSLEKMAVGSAEVTAIKEKLMHDFAHNSLPYLQTTDFLTRFVRAQMSRKLPRHT